MIYHTSRCPYCGYYLEIHNSHHYKIDSELLPCPNCRKLYKTGTRLFEQMTKEERLDFCFHEYCIAFFASLLITPIIMQLICSIFNIDINWVTFLLFFPIILLIALLSTKEALREENNITFEDAILRHWKKYIPDCDSELKNANIEVQQKYNCTFFELEKKTLPAHIYEQTKYNTINERIKFLYNVLENNIVFNEEPSFDEEQTLEEDFPEDVLNIISDKDKIKKILDGEEAIDENIFLGIENPFNGKKIANREDIFQYLNDFYLDYTENANKYEDIS